MLIFIAGDCKQFLSLFSELKIKIIPKKADYEYKESFVKNKKIPLLPIYDNLVFLGRLK